TTKWLWDGNVPLHEWKENQNGDILSNSTVGDNGIVTWVFEENSFIPTAKLKNNKKFSILADHLGTPTSMHNAEGEQTWERSLDTFGKVIKGDNNSCPFMYQGQYYDAEIDLAYNRFRYYDPEDGRYISVDPIGLLSGEFNLYNYVNNPNKWIDEFGLKKSYSKKHKDGATFTDKQKLYVLKKDGKVVYVGITSQHPKRRKSQHKRQKGEDSFDEMVVIGDADSRGGIREMEGSALLDADGGLDLNRNDGQHYHSASSSTIDVDLNTTGDIY
ncbi:RHS repeat domain-containing protein, partial [Lacinutrix sp. MEBiC02404]